MPDRMWQSAAELLARHYGPPEMPGLPGDWTTLVRIVLESSRPARKPRDWSWIAESPLNGPGEALEQTVPSLAEALDAAHYPEAKARTLHALAAWWQMNVGDAEAGDVFAARSVESWQDELRAIPGVNWELADRILLFVGACVVYPLDRGSLRIAARHGWMDVSSDYDDWQAFFTAATRDDAVDLAQLSRWNSLIARDFCKSEPQCDECPLKPLLPERGVVALEGEGD